MKTNLILSLTSFVALAAFASGCGFAARSPEMYRDDTQKLLDTKSADIKACYDGILKGQPGVGGKVTVKFELEEDTGTIKNVVVDQPNTTAPAPVGDCVKNAITGLKINPPDARLGQAAFVYEFSQPPAPPAPPAPPPATPHKS
ncbi:MAG: AgmX/PglI C-terminal domain-containing protein [Labilithrix sp.]